MFHTIFCDIVLFLVLCDIYRLLLHFVINKKFKNETLAIFSANETGLTADCHIHPVCLLSSYK